METSAVKMPGWTVTHRLGMSISSTLFMRPISMTTAPFRASEPPLTLVPKPRATNGTFSRFKILTILATSAVDRTKTTAPGSEHSP